MATFDSDDELLDAVRQASASLALSGLRPTPEEEASLVHALRTGMSKEDYFRAVYARRYPRRCP